MRVEQLMRRLLRMRQDFADEFDRFKQSPPTSTDEANGPKKFGVHLEVAIKLRIQAL